MQLLNKLQYLRLMSEPFEEVTPSPEAAARVLEYSTTVWTGLELKKRKLETTDIAVVFQHGERSFFHIKAFPRKMKDTFLIVVTHSDGIDGHILIDIAAEYSNPFLDCPSTGFRGIPTPDDIKSMIAQIHPDDDSPFAILMLGDGTYMQTYRTHDGFHLEHQLVNGAGHYEISGLATADQVVDAFVSYAFGKNEWLDVFTWQLQQLG